MDYQWGLSAYRETVHFGAGAVTYRVKYTSTTNDVIGIFRYIPNNWFPGYKPGEQLLEVYSLRTDNPGLFLPEEVMKDIEKKGESMTRRYLVYYELARLLVLDVDELILDYCRYQNIRSRDPNYWRHELHKDPSNKAYRMFFDWSHYGKPFLLTA